MLPPVRNTAAAAHPPTANVAASTAPAALSRSPKPLPGIAKETSASWSALAGRLLKNGAP
jgi:hypothetical protein